MIQITINNRHPRQRVHATWLRRVARSVLEAEGHKSAQISIVLVTDQAIHAVNRRFLKHDEPTDVITFPLGRGTKGEMLAELLISYDTAMRVAKEQGHTPRDETALYVIHGLLHLCGFDDHGRGDAARMRRRERWHLKRLELSLKR